MKIPKTFVKEKGSDKDLEKLLDVDKVDKVFNKRIDRLLSGCDDFLHSSSGNSERKYRIGEKFAYEYVYSLEDLENLSLRIFLEEPWNYDDNLGFYFSALINKIIGESDAVKLTTGVNFDGLGACLKKGNLIIDGKAGAYTGVYMTGGKLIVLGDVEDYLGYEMKNGIITVEGSAGGCIGYQADGGEIFVKDIESMIAMSCQAKVYKQGVKVWPADRKSYGTGEIT